MWRNHTIMKHGIFHKIMVHRIIRSWMILCFMILWTSGEAAEFKPASFFAKHCIECHDAETKKGNLDLTSLKPDFADAENFARWVKVHDYIESGEMPPKKKARPPAADTAAVVKSLRESLLKAEQAKLAGTGRTGLRRLTRAEYENTIRDLFDMPGIALQGNLPADGSAHGFDKNSDALDISHVNLAKYVEAAEQTLDHAIATRPQAPSPLKTRLSLLDRGGSAPYLSMQGDVVLLRNQQPDPAYPPAGEYKHVDQGAHERLGSFETGSSVGVFRREDESVNYYFRGHTTIYPGRYRVRTSLWSFQWDKGKVLPSRGTEAARLAVVQLTGDGRGGQHPNTTLGYFDSPSLRPAEHTQEVWLNHNEIMGFDVASLAPVANYSRKGHAMAFTGPAIAVDWMEVEGPLNDVWPPRSHRLLFGELPLEEFIAKDRPNEKAPARKQWEKTWLRLGKNQPEPEKSLWTVRSENPLADADRLLASFLPKAFRRPVAADVRQTYVAKVEERLKVGDCFETAMRWAYRAALCSPDFLYHVEDREGDTLVPQSKAKSKDQTRLGTGDKSVPVTDFALANRLAYFLWNSLPDARLIDLASAGKLRSAATLRAEVERLLKDKKSERFVEDFLGQWLKLRAIAANDADKKLYPEFSPYLQDSMVAETRAYFRELLEKNLDARHLVKSDFVMVNEKLAKHYGIAGVTGAQIRRVPLPVDCPRGGFITQGAILKITANGTTTSPVPRGAFVMDRLFGQPPEPPPPNVAAVEPDVRGATTIRELLDKHRNHAACAGCHAKIDPPGFALESFDVIGGFRTRYRSIGEGDPAPRGGIDPFIGISFKLGPSVDASGALPDERKFADIREFQALAAADSTLLLKNLTQQLAIYATGRGLAFSDRDQIAALVASTQKQGGGVRTLIHELTQSRLFQTR